MQTIRFEVVGKVVGAVRMTQRSKYVDPHAQAYLAYKDQIAAVARETGCEPIAKGAAIEVRIHAHITDMSIDLDNILKSLMDGVKHIAWDDDRDVTSIIARKTKSSTDDLLRVEIEQIGEPDVPAQRRSAHGRSRLGREAPTIGYPRGHTVRDR